MKTAQDWMDLSNELATELDAIAQRSELDNDDIRIATLNALSMVTARVLVTYGADRRNDYLWHYVVRLKEDLGSYGREAHRLRPLLAEEKI